MNALLAEVQRDLAELRDLAEKSTRNETIGSLTELKDKLLRIGLDGQMAVAEIVRVAQAESEAGEGWFDGPNFLFSIKEERKLNESLRSGRIAVGENIIRSESRLRELLSTTADLAIAATNLRLQQRVFWLTIVSVLVAIAAGIVSLVALNVARNQQMPAPASTPSIIVPSSPTNSSPSPSPSPSLSARSSPTPSIRSSTP
jgi:hypothetical protein